VAVLDKAAVLAAIAQKSDVEAEKVDCPELGGELLVREMSGTVRNRLEAAYAAISEGADGKVMDSVLVSLVSTCVVDETGRPYLTGDRAKQLIKNHPKVAFRVRDEVVKLSGVSKEDAEEMAEVFD
jgi:hypothetical protein